MHKIIIEDPEFGEIEYRGQDNLMLLAEKLLSEGMDVNLPEPNRNAVYTAVTYFDVENPHTGAILRYFPNVSDAGTPYISSIDITEELSPLEQVDDLVAMADLIGKSQSDGLSDDEFTLLAAIARHYFRQDGDIITSDIGVRNGIYGRTLKISSRPIEIVVLTELADFVRSALESSQSVTENDSDISGATTNETDPAILEQAKDAYTSLMNVPEKQSNPPVQNGIEGFDLAQMLRIFNINECPKLAAIDYLTTVANTTVVMAADMDHHRRILGQLNAVAQEVFDASFQLPDVFAAGSRLSEIMTLRPVEKGDYVPFMNWVIRTTSELENEETQ